MSTYAREDAPETFELETPIATFAPVAPETPIAPSAPLAGIDWRGVDGEARGEVALFEVTDPGELQTWKTRREVAS